MKIKNLATATLALSMSATSFAALQLVENGDFSNGLDGYGVYNDAGTTFSDGGGYGLIDGRFLRCFFSIGPGHHWRGEQPDQSAP